MPAGTGSASTAVAADSLKNPETAYAIGRALLESDSKAQALAYLTRAALLEPDNPEFAYWEGLGYWSVGSAEQERQSYLRGLEVEPQNVPLLTNLGHSYLGERRYTEALEAYRAVLSIQPEDPTAIYNSGIAYRNLHRVSEEIGAWNSYLRVNRMGSKAARAVQRLNDYGDFSYRIYPIGPRLVILNQTVLLDDAAPPERLYDELFPVMSIMSKNKDVMLEIVVFVDADREAARATASRLKKIIAGAGGSDMESRVAISWFDVPETVISPDGKSEHKLPQSVVLFNRLPDEFSKEITI